MGGRLSGRNQRRARGRENGVATGHVRENSAMFTGQLRVPNRKSNGLTD